MPARPLAYLGFVCLFIFALNAQAQDAPRPVPSFALPADAALPAALEAALPEPAVAAVNPPDQTAAAIHARFKPIDFDPALRAADFAEGHLAAFNYVRDEVRFEAYAGAFRGATGTYMARAGNAADRALLLAALLKAKKIETRFAWGTLTPEQAATLIDRMFEKPAANAATLAAVAQADPARGNLFVERLQARAMRDYAAVLTALGDRLPASATTDRATLVKETVQHAWVQARVDGQWIDLDPSFAGAKLGDRPATLVRTAASLPNDQHQRMIIRVVVERLVDKKIRREVPLEVRRPVEALIDRQIVAFHSPAARAGVNRALGGDTSGQWVPMLWIDGESIAGKPITYEDAADLPAGDGTKKPASGAGGLLDSLPGGGPEAPPAAANPVFISEYLEFELQVTGKPPEISRREVIDRSSPSWRLVPPGTDGLRHIAKDERGPIAAQTLHNIWFSAGRHNLPEYAAALSLYAGATARAAGIAQARAPKPETDPSAAFGQMVWAIAMRNFSCVLWGDHAFLPALNDDPNVRCYLASPRILIFSLASRPAGEADKILIESTIDLRRDVIRGVARDEANTAAVAKRKLWYGLLEGALEHELAVEQALAAGDNQAAATVQSTSATLKAGERLAVLRQGDAAGSEAIKAALEAGKKAGEMLVIPPASMERIEPTLEGVPKTWWAIDANGNTRAVWGADLHAAYHQGGPVGRPIRIPGGSSGLNVHTVDAQGNRMVPRGSQTPKGGGNEHTILLINVAITSSTTIQIAVTPTMIAATVAATAVIGGGIAAALFF